MKYTMQELKDIYFEASARSENEDYERIAERVERVLKGETKCCRFQLWEKDYISECFVEDDDACIVNGTYDEHVKRYGDHAELVMKMYGVKKAKAQTAVTEEEQTAETVESVEETTVPETETVEKVIIRLADDEGNVLCVKVFIGTYHEADEECERIAKETGFHISNISYFRYTDSRWNWMSRKYYCGTDSESALTIVSPITMKIEQAPETAEQETELNTEVETEQTENNAESVSETYGVDVKVDTSKTDELSGATKMLMVFSPVVSEYLRQIEYIDTS